MNDKKKSDRKARSVGRHSAGGTVSEPGPISRWIDDAVSEKVEVAARSGHQQGTLVTAAAINGELKKAGVKISIAVAQVDDDDYVFTLHIDEAYQPTALADDDKL